MHNQKMFRFVSRHYLGSGEKGRACSLLTWQRRPNWAARWTCHAELPCKTGHTRSGCGECNTSEVRTLYNSTQKESHHWNHERLRGFRVFKKKSRLGFLHLVWSEKSLKRRAIMGNHEKKTHTTVNTVSTRALRVLRRQNTRNKV